MNQKCDLAIICAMQLEENAILKLLEDRVQHSVDGVRFTSGAYGQQKQMQIYLVQCGIGSSSVEVFKKFLGSVSPKRILITGLAGGLCPELKTGELVSPSKILSTECDQLISCDIFPELQSASQTIPILLSSQVPLISRESKTKWHQQTGAVAVDMESYPLAKIAAQYNLPVTILRAICDDSQLELDARLMRLIKRSGNPNYQKVLVEIIKSPRFLFVLLKMNRVSQLAMNNLVLFLAEYLDVATREV